MDSVTQIVLGAAVSHTVLGRHIGRRALIIGAVLGTLPDMDELIRYDDADVIACLPGTAILMLSDNQTTGTRQPGIEFVLGNMHVD